METQSEVFGNERLTAAFSQTIATAVQHVRATGSAGWKVSAAGGQAFVEPLMGPPTVVLCGAGHLAYHLAHFARSVNFRVVVCDDRPEYAQRERFPDADEVIVDDFTRLFARLSVTERTYVVIVTRGHASDEAVLEQAVRTDARYIGMIGSRHKTKKILQNLRDKGAPRELLDKVYAPIGISIGAVTAEEIALSIVCELIKVRRLGDAAPIAHLAFSRRERDA